VIAKIGNCNDGLEQSDSQRCRRSLVLEFFVKQAKKVCIIKSVFDKQLYVIGKQGSTLIYFNNLFLA